MEPQLNVLAKTIREEQEKVNAFHEAWGKFARDSHRFYAEGPSPLIAETAHLTGLKQAWKIMTLSDWPVD